MTDRELLELAAKAAGKEYGWQHIFSDYEGSTADKWDWNPLTDDGDALRLAVRLNIELIFSQKGESPWVSAVVKNTMLHGAENITPENNPYAATRRAITRAAAEIGRAMQ
jgi:hypothetical protein